MSVATNSYKVFNHSTKEDPLAGKDAALAELISSSSLPPWIDNAKSPTICY